MLQADAGEEWFNTITQKYHHVLGTLRDIFFCNMFGHRDVDCHKRNMKYMRFYACNKLRHIAKE